MLQKRHIYLNYKVKYVYCRKRKTHLKQIILFKMVKLTNEEEHWLRVYAKENELFESMLTSYEINRYLSSKQRYRIRKEINKEENDGDIILPKEELIFLKEFVEIDSDLEELLEIYEIYGILTLYHNFFLKKF